MISESGGKLGVIRGPLWAPWPQTPQAAEFGAFAWTALYTEGPAQCYSDCVNVVLLQNLGGAEAIGPAR
eukprot:7618164-Pyramimonas_sp.AAC.1